MAVNSHNLRLKLVSNNLHGLNQRHSYAEHLCQNYDIVFLQEHWLSPSDLGQLVKISSKIICYLTSVMTLAVSRGCFRGRPFGDVACLVRDHFATRVQLAKSASRHIILLLDSLLLINVYMPCSSSDSWVDDYLDCLA